MSFTCPLVRVFFFFSFLDLPVKKSKRISFNQQNVCFKPRGLENGPKRTRNTIGDTWQNHASYEVEEVNS